jgi:hypothetical protein
MCAGEFNIFCHCSLFKSVHFCTWVAAGCQFTSCLTLLRSLQKGAWATCFLSFFSHFHHLLSPSSPSLTFLHFFPIFGSLSRFSLFRSWKLAHATSQPRLVVSLPRPSNFGKPKVSQPESICCYLFLPFLLFALAGRVSKYRARKEAPSQWCLGDFPFPIHPASLAFFLSSHFDFRLLAYFSASSFPALHSSSPDLSLFSH